MVVVRLRSILLRASGSPTFTCIFSSKRTTAGNTTATNGCCEHSLRIYRRLMSCVQTPELSFSRSVSNSSLSTWSRIQQCLAARAHRRSCPRVCKPLQKKRWRVGCRQHTFTARCRASSTISPTRSTNPAFRRRVSCQCCQGLAVSSE